MHHRFLFFVVLSLMFVTGISLWVVPASEAAAATYYVAPGGSDNFNGSINAPFGTIKRGLGFLQPGDTLILKDGVYKETVRNIPSGTSWANAVTVKAQNPRQAIIQPPASGCLVQGNNALLNFDGGESYIIIDGLVLDVDNRCPGVLNFRPPTGQDNGGIGWDHIRIINNPTTSFPH